MTEENQIPRNPTPPGCDPPLTLIHFGDLHLWRMGLDGDFAPKRVLGLANLALRRGRRFPELVAQQFVERLSGEEADYVLFSGDLTTTSLVEEFRLGRSLLEPVIQRWGERFLAIPGNHDRYTRRACRQQLFETLFLDAPRPFPFVQRLNQHWSLLGFDCSVARQISSRGLFTPENLDRLRQLLADQARPGQRLIVMAHYPLVYPPNHQPSWEHVLPERAEVFAALREANVALYLHGHVHRRWHLRTGALTHLNCGSAGMIGASPERRPGYLKIRLAADGMQSVEAHYWASSSQEHSQEPAEWVVQELQPLELEQTPVFQGKPSDC